MMHTKMTLGLAILCVACTGQLASVDEDIKGRDIAIVGGTSTTIESAPWQVSLRRRGGHFCGGTILSASWVLTAAHCVESGVGDVSVVAGTSTARGVGQSRNVAGGAIAPGYRSPEFGKDIALLQLDAPLQLDGIRTRPARFVTSSDASFFAPGVVARVTGWGTLRAGGGSPNQLQSVNIPIVSLASARRVYGRVSDDQLAAGTREGGRDSCQGDSGGPLVVSGPDGNAWLAGVVSYGSGCGTPGVPGMYARVASFEEFIRETTGISAEDLAPAPTDPPIDDAPVPPEAIERGSLRRGELHTFGPIVLRAGDTLRATTSGTGDPDLYLGFDRAPTTADFACRSWTTGAKESCSLEAMTTRSAYIVIVGYEAATYLLQTEVIGASAPPAETVSEQTGRVSGELVTGDSVAFQPLRVAGGTRLELTMTGSGDADLFVRFDSAPTDVTYDCRPFLNGSNETCSLQVPTRGAEAYIVVQAARAANYELSVMFTPAN